LGDCLVALPAKMSAFNSHMRQNAYYRMTVIESKPLKICCHIIVTQ